MFKRLLQTTHGIDGYGIAIMRVIVGAIFVYHGSQKIFSFGLQGTAGFFGSVGIPAPTVSAVLAMAAEFLGGIALILGLGVRFAALPMAFTMVVAFTFVHAKHGFSLENHGYEYVLALFGALVALLFTGAGAVSADRLIAGRRQVRG